MASPFDRQEKQADRRDEADAVGTIGGSASTRMNHLRDVSNCDVMTQPIRILYLRSTNT